MSPLPELKLHLKVEVKVGIFAYRQLFNGEVASNLISPTSQGYAVNLDRLPLSERIIPRATVRLAMTYHLEEGSIVSADRSETWVTGLH